MKRAAAIEITGELLQHMLTEGWGAEYLRCTAGLPEGARFAGSYTRQWEGTNVRSIPTAVLVFEHPSFAEIDDGGVIPFLDAEWQEFKKTEWVSKA